MGVVIFDPAGNLYGTASAGWGSGCYWRGCGNVFELTPNGDGTWTETVLSGGFFNTDPGAWPITLIFDGAGNLYGTAVGDYSCCGQVFQGTPNLDGTWSWTTLHSFSGGDGSYIAGSLVFDSAGNLYGTATFGGPYDWGLVFKLTPNPDGSWTESTVYNFTGGADGGHSFNGLIFDKAGNMYGVTSAGGTHGRGTVFQLTPNGDGTWKESVLHSFSGGKDGDTLSANLVMDATGNLYSVAINGGAYGYGVAFELIPNGDGTWKEKVLHHFKGGKDGANPWGAALAFDSAGNLYGTTEYGGAYGYGTVFRLTLGADGKWRKYGLHDFRGQPARYPYAGVTLDTNGNIFGVTSGGSQDCGYWKSDCGAVFEITP